MARDKQGNSKTPIILTIIFLLVIAGEAFFGYTLYQKYNKDKKELKTIQTKVSEMLKTSDDIKIHEDEVLEKLEVLTHIDDHIEEIKQETFKNAKLLEDKIIAKQTDVKIAYLTFDDGPYYRTYDFLKVLKEKNVKATFFTTNVNGENCYGNKNANCHVMYKEYLRYGHTIANHTYTHAIHKGLYKSGQSFMDAVKKQEELIKELTGGYVTNIVRFPGGSGTAKAYGAFNKSVELLKEAGYGYVDWTISCGDGGNLSSADQAWNNFISTVDEPIEVSLMHDYSKYTLKILPKAIDYLRDKGYILLPLFYESSVIKK